MTLDEMLDTIKTNDVQVWEASQSKDTPDTLLFEGNPQRCPYPIALGYSVEEIDARWTCKTEQSIIGILVVKNKHPLNW